MSENRRKSALGPLPGTEEPDYEVGYATPPKHTRFQPGRSGNPWGRPRGALNRKNRIPSINHEHMKLLLREEAYRSISILDGDKLVDIPVIRAILRSVALNAVKGDRKSQQLFVELLETIELENKAAHTEWLETAIEYKLQWERELERRKATGESGPEPLPHPDHVFVDFDANEVEIRGPMTKEEKAELDGMRDLKTKFEHRIAECEAIAATNPEDKGNQETLAAMRRLRTKAAAYLSNIPPRNFRLP